MTLGALRTLGFQFNRIVRHSAHDGAAYENNECAWRAGAERHPESQYLTQLRLSRGHYLLCVDMVRNLAVYSDATAGHFLFDAA